MEHIYLIKIGGSLITKKDSSFPVFKTDVVKKLLKTIFEFSRKTGIKVILGHGAGSFGHNSAKEFLQEFKDLSPDQIVSRLKMIHAEVRLLANEVHSIAQSVGFEPELISPSNKNDLAKAVGDCLHNGKFPIIHGDVNFNGPNFIESTEEQFLKILKSGLKVSHIILATNVDGVLNEDGEVLTELKFAIDTDSNDATGGMNSKTKFALEMSKYCKSVVIISGENLENELTGSNKISTKVSNPTPGSDR